MRREITRTASVVLPVPVEEAWAVLADTPRMVALDPALDAYEPERGTMEAGTLNRVRGRVGPIRTTLVTRTEELDPPTRAVFVSVRPSRPVRARTEDTLEPVEGGCRYRVTVTVTPTVPVVGHLAARLLAATMMGGRRRFMTNLRTAVTQG
jgi:carbon monoxide dehydrogenase subunit G